MASDSVSKGLVAATREFLAVDERTGSYETSLVETWRIWLMKGVVSVGQRSMSVSNVCRVS
jgi:hypothetical protein